MIDRLAPYNSAHCETNLSAFQKEAKKETRISPPSEHPRWKEAASPEKKKGPETPHPGLTPPVLNKKIFKGEHLYLESLAGPSPDRPADWRITVRRREARLAVVRNRWRRRIHEIIRRYRDALLPGCRMKWGLLHLPPERLTPKELEKEIRGLLHRAGILKE